MVPLLALAVIASAPPAAAEAGAPSPELQKLLQDCSAHKFETVIDVNVEGQPHKSKVKLCGTQGQTDADWIRTLKDAIDKVSANPEMPPAAKDQIIAAIKGELARLNSPSPAATTLAGPAPAAGAPPTPLSRDYSTFAPLPAPLAPKPIAPSTPLSRDYSTFAPLPAPPAPKSVTAASVPLLGRPRLTISCFTPGDLAGNQPCGSVDRDTLLTVRADENLAGGTSLRFLRKGEERADVALAQLARGKSVRIAMPREVCAGVSGGRLEIQIVRSAPGTASGGQVVGSEGPFPFRC